MKDIVDNGWADKTTIEEFEVSPKAFMVLSKIIPVLLVIGIIFCAKVLWLRLPWWLFR